MVQLYCLLIKTLNSELIKMYLVINYKWNRYLPEAFTKSFHKWNVTNGSFNPRKKSFKQPQITCISSMLDWKQWIQHFQVKHIDCLIELLLHSSVCKRQCTMDKRIEILEYITGHNLYQLNSSIKYWIWGPAFYKFYKASSKVLPEGWGLTAIHINRHT